MQSITREIERKLKEVEEKENVTVIMAVESGSRAWGFASKDSDYDVRFLYVRRREDYLKLQPPRDVIEWQLDEVLDINGWDIRKALVLLYKSNPTLFEWCNSPIVYRTSRKFDDFRALALRYFSPKAALYHYWSTAYGVKKNFLQGETVRMKKYLYALRPLLACRWILDKNLPPPILFDTLVKEELPEPLIREVDALLQKKKEGMETSMIARVPALQEYIENSLEEIRLAAGDSVSDSSVWDELDAYFLGLFE